MIPESTTPIIFVAVFSNPPGVKSRIEMIAKKFSMVLVICSKPRGSLFPRQPSANEPVFFVLNRAFRN